MFFNLDPTKIVVPPEDTLVKRGTKAELLCKAKHDPSFSAELEILWQKDGQDIYLNNADKSRCFTNLPNFTRCQRTHLSNRILLCLLTYCC